VDNVRDAGIVALVFVVAACLTVFLLGFGQPTTVVVDFRFPRT
jgi:hypothetical protein